VAPAAHLNHALSVKAALPVGSAASSALPLAGVAARKLLPEEKASAELAAPKTPVT